MVVGPTYDQMASSSLRSFIKVSDDLGVREWLKMTPTPSMGLKNKAEILFRSADKPDSLRGPNLSGIWMDEASLMDEEVFTVLIGRLREGGEQGWLTATFTPKGKAHWTYTRFGTKQPDTELFHARTAENIFNPQNFADTLAKQYTAFDRAQELEGLFLDIGGSHFNPYGWPLYEFRGDAWAVGDYAKGQRKIYLNSELTILMGVDVATSEKNTSDFTAFVVGALTRDKEMLILDVFNKQINIAEVPRNLASFCDKWKPHVVGIDDDNIAKATMPYFMQQRAIPPMRMMRMMGRTKVVRNKPAMIWGENGRIYLSEKASWYADFCNQLSAFTGIQAEKDDMADGLGLVARLANELVPSARVSQEPMVLVGARDIGI